MQNKHSGESSSPVQNRSSSGKEIDYSPKSYTPREKLFFVVKLFIITGIGMLLLWLIER